MANLSVSKVARIPTWQLDDVAKELGLRIPAGAMDLEQRAMVARKIYEGGGGHPRLTREHLAEKFQLHVAARGIL